MLTIYYIQYATIKKDTRIELALGLREKTVAYCIQYIDVNSCRNLGIWRIGDYSD